MNEKERLEKLWALADRVMDKLQLLLETGELTPQGLKHMSATMKDIKDIQMLKDPASSQKEVLQVRLEEALQRLSS